MAVVGLFYGSDTGNTENIAKQIQKHLGENLVAIKDIAKSTKDDIANFDFLIFGIPTWYYGESQADWDDFMPSLAEIDFTDKIVAIFGCGDQEDYGEYFCDAMGTIHNIVIANGAIVVGYTTTEGYTHTISQAQIDEHTFVGLCIDEDRQPELTADRVETWCNIIKNEMCLNEL